MATATQAQNRQSALDSLDSLGTSQADYDTADVFSAAEQDVAAFIERVKANINASGMVLTGAIEQMSVRTTEDTIEVIGNDYLLYQDKGVQGSQNTSKAPNSPFKYRDKMPPLGVFVAYVKQKNLVSRNAEDLHGKKSPFEDAGDAEKEILKIARALQIHVYKNGFRPRNVFGKEIPKLKEDLKASIKDFGKNAIKEVFKFKK